MARVLVIEDEGDLAAVLDYNLRQAGLEPFLAATGREGLRLAETEAPDLVLLDLMLPDLSGNEVCRTLKADPRTRDIPVIMLTAKGEEIDRVVGAFPASADTSPVTAACATAIAVAATPVTRPFVSVVITGTVAASP